MTAIDLDNTLKHKREMQMLGQTVHEVSEEEAMRLWKGAGPCRCRQNASVTGAAKPRTVDAVLACPHCGHPAMIEESHPTLPNGETDTLFRVRCTLRECQASTLDWYPASAAVAAWNRRANTAISPLSK